MGAWRNCSVPVPPRTKVPGDGSILPFWPRTCDERRQKILRMGERQGFDQVQDDEFSRSHRCSERQQLPDKMGGLKSRSGNVVFRAALSITLEAEQQGCFLLKKPQIPWLIAVLCDEVVFWQSSVQLPSARFQVVWF